MICTHCVESNVLVKYYIYKVLMYNILDLNLQIASKHPVSPLSSSSMLSVVSTKLIDSWIGGESSLEWILAPCRSYIMNAGGWLRVWFRISLQGFIKHLLCVVMRMLWHHSSPQPPRNPPPDQSLHYFQLDAAIEKRHERSAERM